MAQSPEEKAARAQIAANRKAQAEAVAATDASTSARPTPTQEENDLAKLGVPVELEQSGETEEKSEAADKPAGYKTRASNAG